MSTMPTKDDDTGIMGGGIFSGQYMPAIALAFGSGLKAMGLWKQGSAAVESAQRRQQAAEFEAKQLEINANQAKAASQRDAYFQGLNADLAISAIRARAGSGSMDPTVLNVIGQAMARKSYNVQAALYGGEDKARLMRMQAAGRRYDAALGVQDAKSTRNAYRLQAGAVVAEGASMYAKYWPKNNDPTSGAGAGGGISYADEAFENVNFAQSDAQRGTTITTGIRG